MGDTPKAPAFELKYVARKGENSRDSFFKSFFLAKEGPSKMRVVKASDITPLEVAKKIVAGKETEVMQPEEICAAITKECGANYEGFLKWVESAKGSVKAELKRVATTGDKDFDYKDWAINDREIPRQDNKLAEGPATAVKEDEAEAGRKLGDKPSALPGHGRKVKDYFNRYPDKGGVGEPAKAIDLKSKNLTGPMHLLKKALSEKDEALKLVEAAKKEAAEAKEALKKKAEEEVQNKKAQEIDGILSELTGLGLEEAAVEQARKELSKLEEEALVAVRSVVELLENKGEPEIPGMGVDMGPEGPAPKAPKIETKKPEMAFASLGESDSEDAPVVMPPTERHSNAGLVERFTQMWTQDTLNK